MASNTSGCIGGVSADGGEGPCKPWLEGPYCTMCNVTDTSRYYDKDTSSCEPCSGNVLAPLLLGVGGIAVMITLAALWRQYEPHRTVRVLRRIGDRLWRSYAQLSLHAKGKQVLGFYQIVTRVGAIYDVPMPSAVSNLLSVFNGLNLNIDGIGLPLQCLGYGSFLNVMAMTMILPVLLALGLAVLCILTASFSAKRADTKRTTLRGRRVVATGRFASTRIGTGLLDALPWLLMLSFLVFPMVSSTAFQAFPCEDFDNGRSYLRADYAIECGTKDHFRAKRLAWLGIGFYPIGITVMYIVLMASASHAVLHDRPTALSTALGFLVHDYEPVYMWWELLEAWKKLFLVGFSVLIMPGSIEQLIIAFLFSLCFLLLVSVTMPFKDVGDDNFARACSFSLVSVFFFSIILKVGVLTEEVSDVLTGNLRDRYYFDVATVTLGLIGSIAGSVMLVLVVTVKQMVVAARAPLLKLEATKAPPRLSLGQGQRWHLFLSHIWSTAQDQCASIKRQLCLLLPSVSMFLDVDDLESIGKLEEYIDASQVIMIFVSKGYFKSGNCLREARHAVAIDKPLTLMRDGDRGEMSVADIKRDECPDELLDDIFDGREVIEWHRIKDFQLISLKLLAEQLLLGCPEYAAEMMAESSANGSTKSLVAEANLYCPGEIDLRGLSFSTPPVLYVSKDNPGAVDASVLLKLGMPGLRVVDKAPESLRNAVAEGGSHVSGLVTGRASQSERRNGYRWTRATQNIGGPGRQRRRRRRAAAGEASHMLLYLSHKTWLGAEGQRLAAEVRAARATDLAIVMLHENDEARDGCPFSRFFETTPKDLIQDGLYKALALAWYPGAFRPVSVSLVAAALGASSRVNKGLGCRKHYPIDPHAVRRASVAAVAPAIDIAGTSTGNKSAAELAAASSSTPPHQPSVRKLKRQNAAQLIQRVQRGHATRAKMERFAAFSQQRWLAAIGQAAAAAAGEGSASGAGGGTDLTAASPTVSAGSEHSKQKDYVAYMMFERCDTSGDGKIGKEELSSMCLTLGRTLSRSHLDTAMATLDADRDGWLSFAEFYKWWQAGMSMDTLLDGKKAAEVLKTTRDQRRSVQLSAEEIAQAARLGGDAAEANRAELSELHQTDMMGGSGSEHLKDRPGMASLHGEGISAAGLHELLDGGTTTAAPVLGAPGHAGGGGVAAETLPRPLNASTVEASSRSHAALPPLAMPLAEGTRRVDPHSTSEEGYLLIC